MRKPKSKKTSTSQQSEPSKLKQLTKWSENFGLFRKIIIDGAYVMFAVLLVVAIVKEFSRDEIILDPIVLSEELNKSYNSAIIAEKLLDEANKVSINAKNLSKNSSWHDEATMPVITIASESYLPDLKIPGTDFTIRQLIRFLQYIFGSKFNFLHGEITKTEEGIRLTLRNISKPKTPAVEFSLPNNDVGELIHLHGGEAVLRLAKPRILAIYAYHILLESPYNIELRDQVYEQFTHETEYCKNYLPDTDDSLAWYLEGKALNDIGFALIERNNRIDSRRYLEAAIEKFQKVIGFDSDYKLAYYNWAIALYDLGNKQGAMQKYQKVISLDPNDADVYNNWGVILNELGEYQSAIEKFKKAVELKPNYASAISGWGHSLKALGDIKGADEKFLEAGNIEMSDLTGKLPLKPTEPRNITQSVTTSKATAAQAFITAGDAYLKQGDTQQVIKSYQQSIDYAPQYPIAYKKLGLLFKKLGRNQESKELLKQAKQVKTKNP